MREMGSSLYIYNSFPCNGPIVLMWGTKHPLFFYIKLSHAYQVPQRYRATMYSELKDDTRNRKGRIRTQPLEIED